MSVATLLMGSLSWAPEAKRSKSGKDYIVASVKVANGNEVEFWSVLAFGDDAREALLACTAGEKVALQGSPKFEASGPTDEGHLKLRRTLFVDAVLTARPKPRERKPKAEKPTRAPEKAVGAPLPLLERGGRDFDDEIPF
jgi:hypothetical protein